MSKSGEVFSVSSTSTTEVEEFSVHHVLDMKSACVCLLEAVAVLVNARHRKSQESYQALAQRMFSLDENVFRGVRDRYLWWASSMSHNKQLKKPAKSRQMTRTRSYTGSAEIGLKNIEMEMDKLLLALTNSFDACKSVLLQSLKRRTDKEMSLIVQLKCAQDKVKLLKNQLALSESKLDDTSREREMWFSRFDDLEVQLQNAEEKIAMLEQSRTILAWQKQMDNAMNKHKDEIKKKDEVLSDAEERHRKTYKNMHNRILKLQENVGKLQIKSEFSIAPCTTDLYEKLQHKKQEIYLKEQAIYRLQKEMHEQHKVVAGCFRGLQADYRSLMEKWEIEHPSHRFSPDADNVQFQAMLRYLKDCSSKCSLQDIHKDLPKQYNISNDEMLQFQNRQKLKRTQMMNSKELTLPRTSYKETRKSQHYDSNILSNNLNFAAVINPHQSDALPIRPHSVEPKIRQPSLVHPPNKISTKQANHSHPTLVNTITGRANLLQVMRHFPYLTVDQVSKQWETFRKYDKNNDFCLDLPEMYEVIQDFGGPTVTVQGMKDAMKEVDRDNSNNIDFYEYLKISEMIMKKQGKAAIFQSNVDGDSHASQVCAMQ